MKKTLLLIASFLLFIATGFSQASFNTGAFEVTVNEYGRIRLFDGDGTRELQRASILVGSSATSVFDYSNDAESLDLTELVADPTSSDFEIYGSFDNSYSDLPPAVIVKLNAYGWNNGNYTIVKFNVTNKEANTINALIGLDIIPEINEEYGFDSVSYLNEDGVIRFHRGNQVNMGMTLLSAPLTSLYSFEWFDGYGTDADYWTWMNYGSIQPLYASNTADGPVTITSQASVAINTDESFDVYYAMALGADEQAMLASISAAVDQYQTLITSVNENTISGKGIRLEQNYPNPFYSSTKINYSIPANGFVSLKLYDVYGKEVATLVNSEQTMGNYSISCNSTGLASGSYYYTLKFNDQVKTNKMFLIK